MSRPVTKAKSSFVCQTCGFSSPKWLGKCPDCSSWNTFAEEEVASVPRRAASGPAAVPVLLRDVDVQEAQRLKVGIGELDRVLGGGIVPGSVTLIGGDPGIGKSTISLQLCHALARQGKKILYISGEESPQQTKLRAVRLGANVSENFYIVSVLDIEQILGAIKKSVPDCVVVDSIQVVYHASLSASAGSVSQVRECAALLTQLAKRSGISVFLIGHVTKEGTLAGPRVLEHIVDTVLYFEGERFSHYRVLRATKNRFGSTNEVGVFEMAAQGLLEVKNPSEMLLSERPQGVAGTAVVPVLEGSRPILVEIQALVAKANFGVTRRKAQGIDANRLTLLAAVLEKKLHLKLFDKDVFVNVVGGMKTDDPAVDLAVCVAIGSSLTDRPVPADTVVLGEVGLAAEVRSVAHLAQRLSEAKKLGFKKFLLPRSNSTPADKEGAGGRTAVADVSGAFRALWKNLS